MMELNFKSLADAEVEETMRFEKSLQELRELRSELHKAAEYCETKFSQSEDKMWWTTQKSTYAGPWSLLLIILETFLPILMALFLIQMHFLKLSYESNAYNKLLSCEQYARKLALAKLQWNENSLRFHPRYLSTPPLETSSSKKVIRDSESQVPLKLEDKDAPETYEDLPLFMYTHKPPVQNLKPTTATLNGHINLAMVAPVKDGLSFLTKVSNPFHFQSTQKVGHHRRSLYGSDILWLLRSKRAQRKN
ncbi:hypothetical protein AAZX31_08G037200 [Glycine max]